MIQSRISTPPSLELRVRISTAVIMVEPSPLLYLKLLVVVFGALDPVDADWHPANKAAVANVAISVFMGLPGSRTCG